jgi:hypothetical protein
VRKVEPTHGQSRDTDIFPEFHIETIAKMKNLSMRQFKGELV